MDRPPAAEARGTSIGGRLTRLLDVSVGPFGGTVAVVLVAAGLLVIGLGWNGAAGSGSYVNGVPDIRAQLPWLISGGGLGLALVIVGAALMVTQGQRADRARLEARLEELAEALRAGGGNVGTPSYSAPPRGAAVASGARSTDGAEVVVAGASSYHRPDCHLVSGRDDARHITRDEAEAEDLAPCRICRPDEPASPGRRGGGSRSARGRRPGRQT